eukprot:scaffold128873_cov15-Tisochrysis_lutea.AAC.1
MSDLLNSALSAYLLLILAVVQERTIASHSSKKKQEERETIGRGNYNYTNQRTGDIWQLIVFKAIEIKASFVIACLLAMPAKRSFRILDFHTVLTNAFFLTLLK